MFKVKGIIGTHQFGLYKDGVLVSIHPCQNNALEAKYAIMNTQANHPNGTI